jgi:hypothetical protein
MLDELRRLGYEEALAKARATSVSVPRTLVSNQVSALETEWYAFERESVQYIVVKPAQGTRAEVRLI